MRRTLHTVSLTVLAGSALLGLAPGAAEPAAEVSPATVEPGGTLTISVRCDPDGGHPPGTIDASSQAFEAGTVPLRKVTGVDDKVSGPAYRGTARIAAAETFDDDGSHASGKDSTWTVDGTCPAAPGGKGEEWSAAFTVAHGGSGHTPPHKPADEPCGPYEPDYGPRDEPAGELGDGAADAPGGDSTGASAEVPGAETAGEPDGGPTGVAGGDSAGDLGGEVEGEAAGDVGDGPADAPGRDSAGGSAGVPGGEASGEPGGESGGATGGDSAGGSAEVPGAEASGELGGESGRVAGGEASGEPGDELAGVVGGDLAGEVGGEAADGLGEEAAGVSAGGSWQRERECGGAAVQRGVRAGDGGAFTDSVPALVAGGVLIAGAFGAAAHRLLSRGDDPYH